MSRACPSEQHITCEQAIIYGDLPIDMPIHLHNHFIHFPPYVPIYMSWVHVLKVKVPN